MDAKKEPAMLINSEEIPITTLNMLTKLTNKIKVMDENVAWMARHIKEVIEEKENENNKG